MLCNKQVKTFLLMRQSAWEGTPTGYFCCTGRIPSWYNKRKAFCTYKQSAMHAEKLQHLPSHQRLNVGHPDGFAHWLAGLVDGDGTFFFTQKKNGAWDFCFKVAQSNYN